MEILVFGDIHQNINRLKELKNEVVDADLIIIAGDITQLGESTEAEKIINEFLSVNNSVIAQAGNMDKNSVDAYLTEEGINLHGKGYMYEDVGIFGAGGSSPSPFNTPTEFPEEVIKKLLIQGYNSIKTAPVKIMICHTPPLGTKLDRLTNGTHVGSKLVREFIEEYKPQAAVVGHIHEGKGEDTIGNTRLFNPGVFAQGGYVHISIKESVVEGSLKQI
ncbi:MAG: metallophosphoesterase [Thermodesulfobacteriota bacterium]|nr:metallophosphoesterase [Thermodesulfobacteriota bacterium]